MRGPLLACKPAPRPARLAPSPSLALPRRPLTKARCGFLPEQCANVVLATNPCRVRHFSQELVFFRYNVQRAMFQSANPGIFYIQIEDTSQHARAHQKKEGHKWPKISGGL